jgi:superfamily II DNA or RNA helicase
MSLEIKDFLPSYPNINQSDDDLFNLYDNFYTSIYKKKEFYDEKLPPTEEITDEPHFLFKIQKIIARFLSSNTPYDNLLISHEMGTGKSCTAIATVEQIRSESTFKYKGVIYLASGKGLLDNFVQEIALKCTGGKYIPEEYNAPGNSHKDKMRILRKSVSSFYNMATYRKFAGSIKKMLKKGDSLRERYARVISRYSGYIIIIDEVHNLRPKHNSTEEDIRTYNEIKNFCRAIRNCKILLMSGTPMKDGPEEIASIMNMIIPIELPTGQDFINIFLEKDSNNIWKVKPSKLPALKQAFRGHISYLRVSESTVSKKFIGTNNIPGISYFTIDTDNMSDFQKSIYLESYNLDKKTSSSSSSSDIEEVGGGIYQRSRQSSLFVFPDGTYGSEGFKKNIVSTKQSNIYSNRQVYTYTYSFNPEVKKLLRGNSVEETIRNISKYSSKYAKVIQQILNAKDKSIFIYSQFVQGSGAIVLAKLLELVGFSLATGRERDNSQSLRYALLTDKTTTSSEIDLVKNRFNMDDNKFGNIIKVIIGSGKVIEGFSLSNVQEEHIISPFWNYTPVAQALARGLRAGSHKALISSGIIPVVNIYQHASIPDTPENSIDVYMYSISEFKDISIKRMERIMEESAFDCALTYDRNFVRNGIDGSRECNYEKCEYQCDDITKEQLKGIPASEIDYSTFQLYYSSDNIESIIQRVKTLFRTTFTLNLRFLYAEFKSYTKFEIISALQKIIRESIIIHNKYGFPNYLKEQNNIYFLVNSLSVSGNYYSCYYTQYPYSHVEYSYLNVINKIFTNNMDQILHRLETSSDTDFPKIIKRFPNQVQESILEWAIYTHKNNIQNKPNFVKRVMDFYSTYIHEIDGIWISSLLYEDEILRCLDTEWSDCNSDYMNKYKENLKNIKDTLKSNPYGFYGIFDPKSETFKIVNAKDKADKKPNDKRLINTGKSCKSWKIPELVSIAIALKLNYDISIRSSVNRNTAISRIKDSKSKDIYSADELASLPDDDLYRLLYWSDKKNDLLCSSIMKWFKDNNLMFYGDTKSKKE